MNNNYDQYQSKIDHRFDLIPQVALRDVALTLGMGAEKYGEYNWQNIPSKSHLNHALNHISQFMIGEFDDVTELEDHLIHAICRLMFAYHMISLEIELGFDCEQEDNS